MAATLNALCGGFPLYRHEYVDKITGYRFMCLMVHVQHKTLIIRKCGDELVTYTIQIIQ